MPKEKILVESEMWTEEDFNDPNSEKKFINIYLRMKNKKLKPE